MASEIVSPKNALQLSDAIHDCLIQASAIVDLLGCSKTSANPPADDTPGNAVWAARNLIDGANKMASELFEIAKRVRS